jgi:hypothetical protein
MTSLKSLLLLAFAVALSSAFAPSRGSPFSTSSSALFSAKSSKPKYDSKTERWTAAVGDDGKYPYDPLGSLLRHGPTPFIARLTNADEYEQLILKYMANAGVSRAEATGNHDAKLNNAMDWVYQKNEEKNGAPKVDYTELSTKDAALAVIWATVITPLSISVIQQTVSQF